ncbi:MAG: hypothetical protein AB1468_03400 [Candidatus Micrarchaeota archaeon]
MNEKIKMKNKILLALVALALLSTLAHADCTSVWCQRWQTVALIVLLTMFTVMALIYAVGVGLNSNNLVNFARNEFYQLAATAFMLGMLISADWYLNTMLFPAFCRTSFIEGGGAYTYSSFSCAADWNALQNHAVAYARGLREQITGYVRTMIHFDIIAGAIASMTLMFDIKQALTFDIVPGAAFRPVIDMFGYALSILSIAMIQLRAQEMLLEFARDYMFAFFLPVGIALRAFPFTRMAGGAFIAISVGFYIVLPLAYLASEQIVREHCSNYKCSGSLTLAMAGNARDVIDDMFNRGGSAPSEFMKEMTYEGDFGPMLYMSVVAATILPLMCLIATIMFTRSLASLLGAEIDFTSLIKII